MKRTLLLSCLLLIIASSFSQTWAPIGATWHYTEGFAFSGDVDYIRYKSVGDTVISGKTCSKIIKRHDIYCEGRQHVELMYMENNTVYFYDSAFSMFQTLYDFNANTGDSWIIVMKDSDPNDLDTVRIVVNSTDTTFINGIPKKRMHVTYLCFYEFNLIWYDGTIIETLGDTVFMFNYLPEQGHACDMNYSRGLRCYEDANIGLYQSGLADSCTEQITGVKEKNPFYIAVYPNPSTDVLNIVSGKHLDQLYYSITDLSGREIMSGMLQDSRICTSALKSGCYILKISDKQHVPVFSQKILHP